MKLIDCPKAFATDEMCLAYLEAKRWPHGVRCPVCGGKEISKINRKSKSKNVRAQLYQCLEKSCKTQFSATSGTIFHDSHLPLGKWFMAIALLIDAKKGMSALQLQRHLGVNYRTAWYLAHRIREAMNEPGGLKLTGTVEIDETYIGGKKRGRRGVKKDKDVVMGIRERGGDLRLYQISAPSIDALSERIKENVSPNVNKVMTDEWGAYPAAFIASGIKGGKHETIRHKDKIYVQGEVHTNTVESAFSLLKRAVIGTYHQLSIKHLQRYLNEFSYRFNRREALDMFEQTVARMAGIGAMPYSKLVEQNAFTPFVRP
jgi:transposase-like protein